MRKIILSLLLVLAVPTLAAEVSAPQNVYARPHTLLNGPWNYIVDLQENGYYDYRMNPTPWGFFRNAKPKTPSDLIEYDFDLAATLNVPGDWNTQREDLFFYEGTVWLQRHFDYKPSADRRALLYFGAVNYEAIVYVNGQLMGRHVGGFTPFCYDVTDVLREGDNFVTVKVDNKRHADNVPTRIFDWWNYGGITRDVLLVDVPQTYVADYSLQLTKDQSLTGKKKQLQFWAQLNEPRAGEQLTLAIPELGISHTVTTDAQGRAALTFEAKNLQLWSPDAPKLYHVSLAHAGTETIADEIAFRTIATRGKQILLNGQPIFLKGISIHEEKAYTQGRANSAADADTLLSWAKDLGCNYVRLAHYPHNEHAVRQAERMGIMVWSEIPVYWTISWDNPETYQNAERQLTDMIQRDKNRGNVIIWSIANETPHSASRDSFLSRLAIQARKHDDSRLISMAMEVLGASNYVNRLQDNMNAYVDIISFNQYIGWYRDVHDAPKMTWEIPYDKPVIISEFGGGAVYGRHGDKGQRWTEEFQAELYRQNLAMLDKIDGLSGLSPWILKDFLSPRRQLTGTQDYFNRKGLCAPDGHRKQAFYVMQEYYRMR